MSTILLPTTNQKRVVIIGCGFGGLELAANLEGTDFQVVLFDKNNYHTFQPLLYQVATAGLEAESIAYPVRKFFRKHQNVIFRFGEVHSVDLEQKKIITSIGECSYDYLVIATGTSTNFFGNQEIEKTALPMKTLREALTIRALVLRKLEQATLTEDNAERASLMSFAVVGGGPTGVELAGALCELKNHVLPNDYPDLDFTKMKVYLIESGAGVLQMFTPEHQQKAIQYLKELGAEILLNTRVNAYDGKQILVDENQPIPAQTLIWAAGIKGNEINGISADLQVGGKRYIVDEFNRIKKLDSVFAIGDIACMTTEKFPKGHPQVAQPAMQQGAHLAKNLIALESGKQLTPFEYKDLGSMATVGRNRAVAEIGKIHLSGFLGWASWLAVHLVQLTGHRNRLMVFVNWIWNYINYDRNIRLIIGGGKAEKK